MTLEKSNTTLMMVTYNRLELTKRTLKGLWKLPPSEGPGKSFNLVIVDNGSTDGTREFLEKLGRKEIIFDELILPYTEVIEINLLPENKGIAIGRNIALKMADKLKTKWYCTIDNDVELPAGWLKECVEILEANPSYGAMGVNFEPAPYPLVTRNGHVIQDKAQGNLGTACMVFKKQMHQMLGFFTTEYGLYGEEDADFGMRARVAGFKMGYIERMGTHLGEGEQDTGEYREFKTKQHADNLALFRRNCALYAHRKKPLYIPFKDH